MDPRSERSAVTGVAACTAAAAHRRDHQHNGDGHCHPHAVEVVGLGRAAVAVCHDCCSDSGFLPQRDAERLADGHRHETQQVSVPLAHPA